MSAMRSQKATEDSQNKENINDLRGFNELQILLDFFPGSQNKQVILDSYWSVIFSLSNKSFTDQACSVNMAGYMPFLAV